MIAVRSERVYPQREHFSYLGAHVVVCRWVDELCVIGTIVIIIKRALMCVHVRRPPCTTILPVCKIIILK